MDLRNMPRINLQLVCRVGDQQVRSISREVITENVSGSGFLLQWRVGIPLPEIGSALTVDVDLPERPGFPPRMMQCQTRVVRILWPETDQPSVALEFARVVSADRYPLPQHMETNTPWTTGVQ